MPAQSCCGAELLQQKQPSKCQHHDFGYGHNEYSSRSYSPSSTTASTQQFQLATPPTQQSKPPIILFAFCHAFYSSPLAALPTQRHKPSFLLFIFGRGFYATIRVVAPRYNLSSIVKNKLLVLLSALGRVNKQQT